MGSVDRYVTVEEPTFRKATGEVADGNYFWAVDQVIVPEPGLPTMTAAIRELVRSGQVTSVGVRCESP
jgi:hypothetical protein